MTKLEELIKELCPNGVEHVELKEIGPVCMCKRILKSQTTSNGEVPFYKIGTFGGRANSFISHELYEEYKSKYNFPNKGDILISAAGTIGKLVIYNGEPAYFQDSNIVWIKNSEEKALNKYLYYCYETAPWVASTGGTIARLYNENIERAKIPLPPLAVQREIVRILDKFTLYSQELAAELAARRAQYGYYRDKLLSQNVNSNIQIVRLGDICQVYDGTHQTPKYTNSGIKFVSVENINDLYASQKFISISDYENNYKIKPQFDDVLMTRIGVIGKCAIVDKAEPLAYYVSLALLRPNTNKISSKFLKYFIESNVGQKELRRLTLVNAVPIKVNMGDISKVKIAVPPLEVQERIVKVLDNFDAICSDLGIGLPAEIEKRQQQYEFYRDKLLTFGTGSATIFTDRQTDRAD